MLEVQDMRLSFSRYRTLLRREWLPVLNGVAFRCNGVNWFHSLVPAVRAKAYWRTPCLAFCPAPQN